MNMVKFLRQLNEYSQEEVAKAVGISVSTYKSRKKEESEFKINEIVELSNFYGIKIDKIINENWFKDNIVKKIYE